jgi:hypothetical protein
MSEEDLGKTQFMRRSVSETRGGRQATEGFLRSQLEARLARAVAASAPQPSSPPKPHAPAPAPKFSVSLSTQRFLPPEPRAAPPAPAPRETPRPAAKRGDGWKTLLLVLATGVITVVVSHLLLLK